jgi:hypothetical protein
MRKGKKEGKKNKKILKWSGRFSAGSLKLRWGGQFWMAHNDEWCEWS